MIPTTDAPITTKFEQLRPYLLRVAYSDLGSIGEAEDIVQERGCACEARIEPRSATCVRG